MPGDKGNEGFPGMKGDAGNYGPKGETGDPGPKGEEGMKGNAGMPGMKGYPGPMGDPGIKGDAGMPGLPGEKGDTGYLGPKGLDGMRGFTGPPGIPGEKGETGYPGPKGLDGMPGFTGPIGMLGPKGIRGRKGEPGPVGVKGEAGEGSSGKAPTIYISPSTLTFLEDSVVEFKREIVDKLPIPGPKGSLLPDEAAVSFNCYATGQPAPTIRWERVDKGGVPKGSSGALMITKAQAWHSGQYKCSAFNSHGVNESTVELKVEGNLIFKIVYQTFTI